MADYVSTGMSPFTPLQLQDAGVAAEGKPPPDGPDMPPAIPASWGYGVEPQWAGPSLGPQCTVPNVTSWQVRRYHTRHQNHRRFHYHHAPSS